MKETHLGVGSFEITYNKIVFENTFNREAFMNIINPGEFDKIPVFEEINKYAREKFNDAHIPVSKFESGRDFLDFSKNHLSSDKDRISIFRGHKDVSWSLSATLYRLCNNINESKANDVLEKFKSTLQEMRMYEEKSWDSNELWFLGRHYGLMTPVLDWTYDPRVALYFAFEDLTGSSGNQYSVIYMFNKNLAEKELGDKIKFQDSLCPDNFRAINQKGLFTLTERYQPVENLLNDDSYTYFRKIYIKRTDRQKCIERLDREGISKKTLYPGSIDGAIDYCNQYAQKYYARIGGGKILEISQEVIDTNKEKAEIQEWFVKNLGASHSAFKLESVVNLIHEIFWKLRRKACSDHKCFKIFKDVYDEIFKSDLK